MRQRRPIPKIRYYAPGVHHESIDAHTGDTIYLAPGAVIFGSLNIWQVENVKVFGRGVIIYDGPQDPNDDTGWKHQPNWHCIVMDNARNIEISGITCVVRSRTWMIQMKDSRFITFDNVKVIGGSDANANQDGMDWLGGGDTVVRDVFIRAADDVFAMQGNWDGYSHAAMIAPGHDVTNITVENSVLSTSISNIVRAAWPEKVFNSANFTLRNSDVIHMGIGACGIPFALLDFWATNGATGHTSGYRFENIRLEDWYSLVQIEQPNPSVRDITFKNIWAIETPSLVPSTLLGDVDGITFDHVRLAGKVVAANADIPLNLESGAKQPTYSNTAPHAAFTYSTGALSPRKKITFDASPSGPHIRTYEWSFGDGSTAKGRKVHHKFPDAAGTLWDNSGRFRVTLKVTADDGDIRLALPARGRRNILPRPRPNAGTDPGLNYPITKHPQFARHTDTSKSRRNRNHPSHRHIRAQARRKLCASSSTDSSTSPPTAATPSRCLRATSAKLEIDSVPVAVSPKPFAQVCGSIGNAMQATTGSLGLRAGRHAIRVQMTHTTGPSDFALKWQGPGLPLSDIPAERPLALTQALDFPCSIRHRASRAPRQHIANETITVT